MAFVREKKVKSKESGNTHVYYVLAETKRVEGKKYPVYFHIAYLGTTRPAQDKIDQIYMEYKETGKTIPVPKDVGGRGGGSGGAPSVGTTKAKAPKTYKYSTTDPTKYTEADVEHAIEELSHNSTADLKKRIAINEEQQVAAHEQGNEAAYNQLIIMHKILRSAKMISDKSINATLADEVGREWPQIRKIQNPEETRKAEERAEEISGKLQEIDGRIWGRLGIESVDPLMEDPELQKRYMEELDKEMSKLPKKYQPPYDDEIQEVNEDVNSHLLNEALAIRGDFKNQKLNEQTPHRLAQYKSEKAGKSKKKPPVHADWDELSEDARAGLLAGSPYERMASKKWSEMEPWLQEDIQQYVRAKSNGYFLINEKKQDAKVEEPKGRYETVLYGVREGDPDYKEEIISENPKDIEHAKEWARKQGFVKFRVAKIDMGTPPDFVGAISKGGDSVGTTPHDYTEDYDNESTETLEAWLNDNSMKGTENYKEKRKAIKAIIKQRQMQPHDYAHALNEKRGNAEHDYEPDYRNESTEVLKAWLDNPEYKEVDNYEQKRAAIRRILLKRGHGTYADILDDPRNIDQMLEAVSQLDEYGTANVRRALKGTVSKKILTQTLRRGGDDLGYYGALAEYDDAEIAGALNILEARGYIERETKKGHENWQLTDKGREYFRSKEQPTQTRHGSGWGEAEKRPIYERILYMKDVNEGDIILTKSKRFNDAKNVMLVTRVDRDKGIFYGYFVNPENHKEKRMPSDQEFAVWAHDLEMENEQYFIGVKNEPAGGGEDMTDSDYWGAVGAQVMQGKTRDEAWQSVKDIPGRTREEFETAYDDEVHMQMTTAAIHNRETKIPKAEQEKWAIKVSDRGEKADKVLHKADGTREAQFINTETGQITIIRETPNGTYISKDGTPFVSTGMDFDNLDDMYSSSRKRVYVKDFKPVGVGTAPTGGSDRKEKLIEELGRVNSQMDAISQHSGAAMNEQQKQTYNELSEYRKEIYSQLDGRAPEPIDSRLNEAEMKSLVKAIEKGGNTNSKEVVFRMSLGQRDFTPNQAQRILDRAEQTGLVSVDADGHYKIANKDYKPLPSAEQPKPQPSGYDVEVPIVSTRTGETYHVRRKGDDWSCTCQGYQYSKRSPKGCKHITKVQRDTGWATEYKPTEKTKAPEKKPDVGTTGGVKGRFVYSLNEYESYDDLPHPKSDYIKVESEKSYAKAMKRAAEWEDDGGTGFPMAVVKVPTKNGFTHHILISKRGANGEKYMTPEQEEWVKNFPTDMIAQKPDNKVGLIDRAHVAAYAQDKDADLIRGLTSALEDERAFEIDWAAIKDMKLQKDDDLNYVTIHTSDGRHSRYPLAYMKGIYETVKVEGTDGIKVNMQDSNYPMVVTTKTGAVLIVAPRIVEEPEEDAAADHNNEIKTRKYGASDADELKAKLDRNHDLIWKENKTTEEVVEEQSKAQGFVSIPEGPTAGHTAAEAPSTETEAESEVIAKIWAGEPGYVGYSRADTIANLNKDRETLAGVKDGSIRPSKVIGGGYKNPRKVAIEYLNDRIAEEEELIRTNGHSSETNRRNAKHYKPGGLTDQQTQQMEIEIERGLTEKDFHSMEADEITRIHGLFGYRKPPKYYQDRGFKGRVDSMETMIMVELNIRHDLQKQIPESKWQRYQIEPSGETIGEYAIRDLENDDIVQVKGFNNGNMDYREGDKIDPKIFDEWERKQASKATPADAKVGTTGTSFSTDEAVIMHSPNTGADTEVNYRGRDGDNAVVWTGKSQITVPLSWLSHKIPLAEDGDARVLTQTDKPRPATEDEWQERYFEYNRVNYEAGRDSEEYADWKKKWVEYYDYHDTHKAPVGTTQDAKEPATEPEVDVDREIQSIKAAVATGRYSDAKKSFMVLEKELGFKYAATEVKSAVGAAHYNRVITGNDQEPRVTSDAEVEEWIKMKPSGTIKIWEAGNSDSDHPSYVSRRGNVYEVHSHGQHIADVKTKEDAIEMVNKADAILYWNPKNDSAIHALETEYKDRATWLKYHSWEDVEASAGRGARAKYQRIFNAEKQKDGTFLSQDAVTMFSEEPIAQAADKNFTGESHQINWEKLDKAEYAGTVRIGPIPDHGDENVGVDRNLLYKAREVLDDDMKCQTSKYGIVRCTDGNGHYVVIAPKIHAEASRLDLIDVSRTESAPRQRSLPEEPPEGVHPSDWKSIRKHITANWGDDLTPEQIQKVTQWAQEWTPDAEYQGARLVDNESVEGGTVHGTTNRITKSTVFMAIDNSRAMRPHEYGQVEPEIQEWLDNPDMTEDAHITINQFDAETLSKRHNAEFGPFTNDNQRIAKFKHNGNTYLMVKDGSGAVELQLFKKGKAGGADQPAPVTREVELYKHNVMDGRPASMKLREKGGVIQSQDGPGKHWKDTKFKTWDEAIAHLNRDLWTTKDKYEAGQHAMDNITDEESKVSAEIVGINNSLHSYERIMTNGRIDSLSPKLRAEYEALLARRKELEARNNQLHEARLKARKEAISMTPEVGTTKEPWETSDLARAPNMSEIYTQAKQQSDGKFKLFYRGTSNEVFQGRTFESASEAKMFFREQQKRAQAGAPKEPVAETVAQFEKQIADAKTDDEARISVYAKITKSDKLTDQQKYDLQRKAFNRGADLSRMQHVVDEIYEGVESGKVAGPYQAGRMASYNPTVAAQTMLGEVKLWLDNGNIENAKYYMAVYERHWTDGGGGYGFRNEIHPSLQKELDAEHARLKQEIVTRDRKPAEDMGTTDTTPDTDEDDEETAADWLQREKGITIAQFTKMSMAEQKVLQDEFEAYDRAKPKRKAEAESEAAFEQVTGQNLPAEQITDLKAQNEYSRKQIEEIGDKPDDQWAKKEYEQVIKDNEDKINKLERAMGTTDAANTKLTMRQQYQWLKDHGHTSVKGKSFHDWMRFEPYRNPNIGYWTVINPITQSNMENRLQSEQEAKEVAGRYNRIFPPETTEHEFVGQKIRSYDASGNVLRENEIIAVGVLTGDVAASDNKVEGAHAVMFDNGKLAWFKDASEVEKEIKASQKKT